VCDALDGPFTPDDKAYHLDRLIEKHEGWSWDLGLSYVAPELLDVDGYHVLLPLSAAHTPNLSIVRCIAGKSDDVLTIFLRDITCLVRGTIRAWLAVTTGQDSGWRLPSSNPADGGRVLPTRLPTQPHERKEPRNLDGWEQPARWERWLGLDDDFVELGIFQLNADGCNPREQRAERFP
jgi:hypothetical protein